MDNGKVVYSAADDSVMRAALRVFPSLPAEARMYFMYEFIELLEEDSQIAFAYDVLSDFYEMVTPGEDDTLPPKEEVMMYG